MIIKLRATALLTFACILGSLSILPTIIAARARIHAPDVPDWELYGSAVLQSVILFAPAAFLGLCAAQACGLKGAPLVERWVGGDGKGAEPFGFLLAALAGIAGGTAMVLADVLVFQGHAFGLRPGFTNVFAVQTFWTGLLGGILYGGINEEVLMRLFLVSSLIWGLSKIGGEEAAQSRSLRFLVVIAAALIFGLAHLPLTSTMVSIDMLVITRALVLNGIIGVLAGLVYLRYGFEAAVLTHAISHIPIQIGGGVLV